MNRQGPQLKSGVDFQLQSAFLEGNWATVIRLAEKRARTFSDDYYNVVKAYAESQLDDPIHKLAALSFVEKAIKSNATIKDANALDLLEHACQEIIGDGRDGESYAASFGPLRVRAVKASLKDKTSCLECLDACLLHWDLVSAQQIAAMLDRSFAQDRSLMFFNIVITYMLSTSSQSPPEKKALYGMLALKQIERAAQAAEQIEDGAEPPARSVQTEEEILLLYRILEAHGSAESFTKLVSSPVFSPAVQFRKGRKETFRRVAARLESKGEWQTLFNLCRDCLADDDESGNPSLLAADWIVWKQFIAAAGELRSVNPNVTEMVQGMLLKLAQVAQMRPIYRRNILLARLQAVFTLGSTDSNDVVDGQPKSTRMLELIEYIKDQAASPSCFGDIKGFLEQLDQSGIKHIAYSLVPGLINDSDDTLKSTRLQLLKAKCQYFASLCPLLYESIPGHPPSLECSTCSKDTASVPCDTCVSSLAASTLEIYNSLSKDAVSDTKLYEDVLPEYALLAALCKLQLTFRGSQPLNQSSSSRYLVQALLILEHQLSSTPRHSVLILYAVQVHILLGSAYRAREAWDFLGVKRTIVDSLGPLLYDRLSTISPIALSPTDKWGRYLMDSLESHYEYSLKLRMPQRLIDAFEAGSYDSAVSIPEYQENLRLSCTRAMGLVEGQRVKRLMGLAISMVLDDARFVDVVDEPNLVAKLDYGSFGTWEPSSEGPLYTKLRIGPPPSARRSRLSVLAEAFQSLLTQRNPTAYKPASTSSADDQSYIFETSAQISTTMNALLPSADVDVTPEEKTYFDTITLLSTLIPLVSSGDKTTSADATTQICEAVEAGIDSLRTRAFISDSLPSQSIEKLTTALRTLHALTLFHDTASITKATCSYILTLASDISKRDPSGRSNISKNILTSIKTLLSVVETALKDGKAYTVKMKEEIGGDLRGRVKAWVREGDGEFVDRMVEDGVLEEVCDSWRVNVNGWQQVRWE